MIDLSRRDLLKLCSTGAISYLLPARLLGSEQSNLNLNRVILVQLKGGNDYLNTTVPYADPLYQKLRPNLALERSKLLSIDEKLGLHPSLTKTREIFNSKKLAIILGVGYDNPNLSHFRSTDIIETGSESDQVLTDGWVHQVFLKNKINNELNGVILGDPNLGPLAGQTHQTLVLNNPKRFLKQSKRQEKFSIRDYKKQITNEALEHILKVEQGIKTSLDIGSGEMAKAKNFKLTHINTLLQLIKRRPDIPLFRITLDGFDTHVNQLNTHQRLLSNLDLILENLKNNLIKQGTWNQTLILTYTEFGRRPSENQSAGTDHGTASVSFAMGGAVKGGIYGARPNLSQLQNENLSHSIDYREIYQTLIHKWWKLKNSPFSQKPLNFI